MVFTQEAIQSLALPPGKNEERWFDDRPDAPSNFGLKLVRGKRQTQRTYIVQHRHQGEQRTPSFGRVSDVSLAEATLAARKYHAALMLDEDPQAKKRAAREARKAAAEEKARDALTFGKLVDSFMAHMERNGRSAKHVSDVRRYLVGSWKPLSEMRVDRIERRDVAARLAEIARLQSAITGNRARAALSSFFNWAMGEGLVSANPVAGTNKPLEEERSRERVLSDDELVAIWKACQDDDYGRAVKLLMLTGQRRGEVEGIRWSEVGSVSGLWTMPGDRTKNGRPHEIPLSAPALAILDPLRESRDEERDLVFGYGQGGFSGWSKAKAALDERITTTRKEAGLAKPELPEWRHHDLRRTVATRMGDLGVQPHVIEVVLNHVSGFRAGVAGVYNKAAYRGEKRQALDLWGAHILALVAEGV